MGRGRPRTQRTHVAVGARNLRFRALRGVHRLGFTHRRPTMYKVFPAAVALIAAINIIVVARRKSRGEPG